MRRAAGLFMIAASVLAAGGCATGTATPAGDIGTSGAQLHGVVVDTTDASPAYWFAYGRSTTYGSETPHRTITVAGRQAYRVSARVSGLDAGTAYHYRLCAADPGQGPACSADRTFTTHGPLRITAQPDLFPAFAASVSDYVTRCDANPVAFTVDAPPGTAVRVGDDSPRSGHFEGEVSLTPGQATVIRTATATKHRTYHVRCLPADFPRWTFSRTGRPSTVAFTITTPTASFTGPGTHYAAIFDAHGVPVWWFRDPNVPFDAKLLADDTVAYGSYPSGSYAIRRLDGTLVRTVHAVGIPTDSHELQTLPNGDDLVVAYRPRAHVDLTAFGGPADSTVLDAVIQEVARDGSLVWSWSSKAHISLAETGRWWPTVLTNGSPYDLVHINAVDVDGGGLLVSFRHLDAVYRIARSDGRILWKVGGTATPQSLTVSGDTQRRPLGGQHDVRRLPDGTISVHDNGTGLNRHPRALRFRVDASARKAKLVEALRDPNVPSSLCCGSARRLTDGHWLVDWGGTPRISEYAPGGLRVSTLALASGFSYRAVPVAPGRLSITQLRRGMNSQASAVAAPAQRPRRHLTPREQRAAAQSALPARQAAGREKFRRR
jgi:hypothetical protein